MLPAMTLMGLLFILAPCCPLDGVVRIDGIVEPGLARQLVAGVIRLTVRKSPASRWSISLANGSCII